MYHEAGPYPYPVARTRPAGIHRLHDGPGHHFRLGKQLFRGIGLFHVGGKVLSGLGIGRSL